MIARQGICWRRGWESESHVSRGQRIYGVCETTELNEIHRINGLCTKLYKKPKARFDPHGPVRHLIHSLGDFDGESQSDRLGHGY